MENLIAHHDSSHFYIYNKINKNKIKDIRLIYIYTVYIFLGYTYITRLWTTGGDTHLRKKAMLAIGRLFWKLTCT